MKRFLTFSLLMLLVSTKAWCCGDYGSTHNYYMFSMFPYKQSVWDDPRLNQFWETYTNGKVNAYYNWNRDEIVEVAKQKNDKDMLTYLELLNLYLDNSGEISKGWDYPTEEELNKQGDTMKKILQEAKAYTGTKMQQQFSLLVMRANMQLEKHADNKAYWENTASKLSDSAYREIMKNIYAGCRLLLVNLQLYSRRSDPPGKASFSRWPAENQTKVSYAKEDATQRLQRENPPPKYFLNFLRLQLSPPPVFPYTSRFCE